MGIAHRALTPCRQAWGVFDVILIPYPVIEVRESCVVEVTARAVPACELSGHGRCVVHTRKVTRFERLACGTLPTKP